MRDENSRQFAHVRSDPEKKSTLSEYIVIHQLEINRLFGRPAPGNDTLADLSV
jgi:hypothetical protein